MSIFQNPADQKVLSILILNLMPLKQVTEKQWLRLIHQEDVNAKITWIRTASREATHEDPEHLAKVYKQFKEVEHLAFDALIVTGAPVEHLEFEAVDYWSELTEILDWADTHVKSVLHICWAAQAGLYHRYGIPKVTAPEKIFGVFKQTLVEKHPLLEGIEEGFEVPHSRHTGWEIEDLKACEAIRILAFNEDIGVHALTDTDGRHVYLSGHGEYDAETLHLEYVRDLRLKRQIQPPKRYYKSDGGGLTEIFEAVALPEPQWQLAARRVIRNWLAYHVERRLETKQLQHCGGGLYDEG